MANSHANNPALEASSPCTENPSLVQRDCECELVVCIETFSNVRSHNCNDKTGGHHYKLVSRCHRVQYDVLSAQKLFNA